MTDKQIERIDIEKIKIKSEKQLEKIKSIKEVDDKQIETITTEIEKIKIESEKQLDDKQLEKIEPDKQIYDKRIEAITDKYIERKEFIAERQKMITKSEAEKINRIKRLLGHYEQSVDPFDRLKQFSDLIEATQDDEKQGSEDWHKKRSRAIGGSEIGKVMDMKFESRGFQKFILEKFGYAGGFNGNIHTRFGHLFEPVSRMIMNVLFETDIREFTSLPGFIDYTSYSPDGISSIIVNDKIYFVVWEFKSPCARGPMRKINPEYLMQVKSGLIHIRFTDFAIFVNAAYRVVGLSGLFDGTINWNTIAQPNSKAYSMDNPKLYAIGLIVIYTKDSRSTLQLLSDIKSLNEDRILLESEIDYGSLTTNDLDLLFESLEDGDHEVEYLDPIILDTSFTSSIKQTFVEVPSMDEIKLSIKEKLICLRESCKLGTRIKGVLPYKLLDIDCIIQARDESVIPGIKKVADKFGSIAKQMELIEDPEEKRKALYQLIGFEELLF